MAESIYKNDQLHSVTRYANSNAITFEQFLNDRRLI